MPNKETKKIIVGAVIGGLIGGAALYLLKSASEKNKPVLDKIGQAISDIGEILEESKVEDRDEAIGEIGKSLPQKDDTIDTVLTWVATGINLWKNFKKGM